MIFRRLIVTLLSPAVLILNAPQAAATHIGEGAPRPCRFQIKSPEGAWGKLVARSTAIEAEAAGKTVRWTPNTQEYMPRFIVCWAKRKGINPDFAKQVAGCESGMNPKAYNAAGPYYGIYQYLKSTWQATKRTYGMIKASIYNGYAQVRNTMKKWAAEGTGEWGDCA